LLALSLIALVGVSARVRGDAIDDYLKCEQAARQIPGLALAVVRQGRIERISAYGLANLETDTPVTPNSVFALASLDKGIIASGVLKAAELGKLAVDDPVVKFVDVPFPSATLAMLLSHTSGLPDMDEALAEHCGARTYHWHTTEDLLAAVRVRSPPQAPNITIPTPGSSWLNSPRPTRPASPGGTSCGRPCLSPPA
jgi:CubicO group peptidase (beta-lactamase class C family)